MAMDLEMARDKDVFLMGEEVGQYKGAYKVSQDLYEKHGLDRVLDMPITEYGFTGIAVGSAMAGLRPICEFMTWNFSLQSIDHIINSAAKTFYMSGGQVGCPIVFRGPNGASAGVAAQHSQCFASMYASIPGLKVVAPYSAADCKGMLASSIRDDAPVVFLESEMMYGKSFVLSDVEAAENYLLPLDKAHVEREGSDVTLVAYGHAVHTSLEAAARLQEEHGISAEVINLRSVRPIDQEAVIQSVCKTHHLVSVEEGWAVCGIGSEIAAILMETKAFDQLDAPMERVTGADVPMPYAVNLEAAALPVADTVISAVKRATWRRS